MTSRLDMFKKLGAVKHGPDLSALTTQIYSDIEDEIYNAKNSRVSSSFWASNFPISPTSCDRQNVYRLLNIPSGKPFSVSGRAITLIGNAVEEQIAYRWGHAGITVAGSVPLKEGAYGSQLSIGDNDTWLYGKIDAVLDLRPKIKTVLPVDIKSKNNEVIKQMVNGEKNYDLKHYAQVQAYIYLCNLIHDEMGWNEMGLGKAVSAAIFYASREDPSKTFTFYIDANWQGINNAIVRLKKTKQQYLEGELPERDPEFMWSKDECQWCEFKKFACKPDFKLGIPLLEESTGIEFAKTIREDYDYDKIRKKVKKRWT